MKKIVLTYYGSYVKTTSTLATLILLFGILITCILLILTFGNEKSELLMPAIYTFGSSIFTSLLLISLSKILHHLLYIRACSEAKLIDLGYSIEDKEVNSGFYEIFKDDSEQNN